MAGGFLLARRHALALAVLTASVEHRGPPPPAQYDRFAAAYDKLDGGVASKALGMQALRRSVLQTPLVRGSVLEVGIGTGLNLPFYDLSQVTRITGVDESAAMLDRARTRGVALGLDTRLGLEVADAARLPFADETFDVVVDTFSLCVFKEPAESLREMARVLKQSGVVVLAEHQRARGLLGAYQDVLEPLVTPLSKGCVWNQDVGALVQTAGLEVVHGQGREAAMGTLSTFVLRKGRSAPSP